MAVMRKTSASAPGTVLLLARLARTAGHRVGEALEAMQMRTHEFPVLNHLAEAGPLSQQELGVALRINPSNLVGLLDVLEADGLLVRTRDRADRRRHLVELTAAGRNRLAKAWRAAQATELELLAPLTPAERAQLHASLKRLVGHSCGAKRGC
jgi:DNA-binding MarR family transcriptional regulator